MRATSRTKGLAGSEPAREADDGPYRSRGRWDQTRSSTCITSRPGRQGPWKRTTGSNPRPSAWEADALPTELRPRLALTIASDSPMALIRAVLLVALVALAAGCALAEDSEDHEAGAAVKALLEKEYFGDYGWAWTDSIPGTSGSSRARSTTKPPRHRRPGHSRVGRRPGRRGLAADRVRLPPNTPAKEVQVRVVTDESEYTADYHVVGPETSGAGCSPTGRRAGSNARIAPNKLPVETEEGLHG